MCLPVGRQREFSTVAQVKSTEFKRVYFAQNPNKSNKVRKKDVFHFCTDAFYTNVKCW